ncbi:hypothetical protein B0H14DRAFT_2591074 [Mycena olivaceomarginata]|nr:hypothetical protein B0H14DRAFT_2591074 [Mycena olivaceomarginata]
MPRKAKAILSRTKNIFKGKTKASKVTEISDSEDDSMSQSSALLPLESTVENMQNASKLQTPFHCPPIESRPKPREIIGRFEIMDEYESADDLCSPDDNGDNSEAEDGNGDDETEIQEISELENLLKP